jgi:hypothetical protein
LYIHSEPEIIRLWWSRAVVDVVERLGHVEEENDDLPPLEVMICLHLKWCSPVKVT